MSISNETRKKWDDKLDAIEEAREIGIVVIYSEEINFLKGMNLKRKYNRDLTHGESKWLNRIYERIK